MVPASFCAPRAVLPEQELAPLLQQADLGVIAMKQMAAADRESGYIYKLQPPTEKLAELVQPGMSLGNLTVKYLLQFDMVSTVLPAMNSMLEVLEVLENCRASGDGPLTGDEERFLAETISQSIRTVCNTPTPGGTLPFRVHLR